MAAKNLSEMNKTDILIENINFLYKYEAVWKYV
jgi:hypothetical protein